MSGYLLSLATALLLLGLYPPFGWTLLAPVALAPLIVACALERSWKKRLHFGWLGGTVYWGGICYWIQFVLEVHGGMGRYGSWGAFLLYAVLKGVSMAVFAVLAGWLADETWGVLPIAALWTGIERLQGPLGFTWLQLGNAGIEMPLPLRLAPLTGVYGLSFLFALLGCAVAWVILRRSRVELAPLAVLVALPFLPAPPDPATPREAVHVVQPNIDTEREWDSNGLIELEQNMALLSRGSRAPLIVWPEAPAPFYPSDPAFSSFIGEVARSSNAHLMLGAVGRTDKGEPLNSAYYLNEDGQVSARYDKIHLVPFGEFVPSVFSFVHRITAEAGDFAAGDHIVTFRLNGERLGAFICYESAFPELVRKFVKEGAGALVNLSNDGYFGKSAAREQHLLIVRMRAAENRRWILRATNDGITAMIDPAGRVTDRLEPGRQVSGTMRYSNVHETTPYTNLGDWFAWICLAGGLMASGFAACNAFRR